MELELVQDAIKQKLYGKDDDDKLSGGGSLSEFLLNLFTTGKVKPPKTVSLMNKGVLYAASSLTPFNTSFECDSWVAEALTLLVLTSIASIVLSGTFSGKIVNDLFTNILKTFNLTLLKGDKKEILNAIDAYFYNGETIVGNYGLVGKIVRLVIYIIKGIPKYFYTYLVSGIGKIPQVLWKDLSDVINEFREQYSISDAFKFTADVRETDNAWKHFKDNSAILSGYTKTKIYLFLHGIICNVLNYILFYAFPKYFDPDYDPDPDTEVGNIEIVDVPQGRKLKKN
jgi:hypothetical protein